MPPTSNNGKNAGTTEPSYRGDIIVDTCVLLEMISDIPKDKQYSNSKTPVKYIDLLSFLAKNGYHIIIPEMISYEAGKVLASGTDVGKYYSGERKYGHDILSPFLKDAAQPEGSQEKVNPNIEILHNTGPKEIDRFLESMHRIVADYTARLKELRRDHSKNFNREIAELLAKNEVDYGIKDAKNQLGNYCGDDSIRSLVGRNYKRKDNKLVVLLTDDNDLRMEMRRDFPSVESMTATYFIYSIANAGFGEEIGFDKSLSIEDLEKKRRLDCNTIANKKVAIPEKLHSNESGYIERVNSRAFAKSLAELAADLKRQKAEKPDAGLEINNSGGEDRVAAFRAKYAKKPPINAQKNIDISQGR